MIDSGTSDWQPALVTATIPAHCHGRPCTVVTFLVSDEASSRCHAVMRHETNATDGACCHSRGHRCEFWYGKDGRTRDARRQDLIDALSTAKVQVGSAQLSYDSEAERAIRETSH